jgi:cellulose biosynthesis protein BcsQ
MKTIAFFNNKGGVGKTSLIYHLGYMFAELGLNVLAADLDPQSNLTAMSLSEDRLESIYEKNKRRTIYTSVEPLKRGVGDLKFDDPVKVYSRLFLIPGDLSLSDFEDELSVQWPKCVDRDERAFRVTSAFYRIIQAAGKKISAHIGLIDVGPNFGAINRTALLAADFVLIPVAPDLFSVEGLQNVGVRLKAWRAEWRDRIDRAPSLDFGIPSGGMRPIGYVVSRHTIFAGGAVRAYQRWIDRIPEAYREYVENPNVPDQELMLGRLKDYRSLIALAQEARKPMFLLRPSDGAIGGHQGAVSAAYDDFEKLAREITDRISVPLSPEVNS